MASPIRRLRILEGRLAPPACPVCFDRPHRVVEIDAAGVEVSESMPATGCPECGRPVFREYQLIDDGYDDGQQESGGYLPYG